MTTKRKSRAKLAHVLPDPEGSVRMSREDAEEVRLRIAIIMHYREMLGRLENDLVDKLETGYGANCRDGGGWSLNAAEGRLDRTSP
jgi:hypothetical protein